MEALVSDGIDILLAGQSGANEDDFYAEAHSYWSLIEPRLGVCLLLENAPTEHAVWFSGQSRNDFVLASGKKTLEGWKKASGRELKHVEPALVLRVPFKLFPANYPLTPGDLIALAHEVGATQLLRYAVERWKQLKPLIVVLCFEHEGADILLCGELPTPQSVVMPGARHSGIPGFRFGAGSASARLKALSMVRHRFPHRRANYVHRNFLHDRTAGESARQLREFHVVVLGCGALGGQLAVQLAQAGVGKLTLLDEDLLDWRNVGRHVLDGTFVGINKAAGVRTSIIRRFPDAEVAAHGLRWEDQYRVAPQPFERADLIVSATAEPASNLRLDALAEAGEIAPTIFAWMEPFAVCAHAVFRYPSQGGLRDMTDTCGRLIAPVVDFEQAPELPKEHSCGAFYQPYSSISALSCVSLVAEFTIDVLLGKAARSEMRTWVGSAESFQSNHLSITPSWHSRLNSMGFSRRYAQPIFPKEKP